MSTATLPIISCLTVTRAARLPLLALAIGDYARQHYAARELVVVHDDGPAFSAQVSAVAAQLSAAHVRVHAVDRGLTLGELRNLAVDRADGALVCQWDDDDRYHPQRLALQAQALSAANADFAFLVDQLHWFVQARRMSWDDWRSEAYPLDFVQGTLLARRAAMPRYVALARGEDTALCQRIVHSGAPIARLEGVGWCYIYVCHQGNVWSEAHHWAIAQAKGLRPARLLARAHSLAQRVAEYAPPPGRLDIDPAGAYIRIS